MLYGRPGDLRTGWRTPVHELNLTPSGLRYYPHFPSPSPHPITIIVPWYILHWIINQFRPLERINEIRSMAPSPAFSSLSGQPDAHRKSAKWTWEQEYLPPHVVCSKFPLIVILSQRRSQWGSCFILWYLNKNAAPKNRGSHTETSAPIWTSW